MKIRWQNIVTLIVLMVLAAIAVYLVIEMTDFNNDPNIESEIMSIIRTYYDGRKVLDAELAASVLLPHDEGGMGGQGVIEFAMEHSPQFGFTEYRDLVLLRLEYEETDPILLKTMTYSAIARTTVLLKYDKCDSPAFQVVLVYTEEGWMIKNLNTPFGTEVDQCIEACENETCLSDIL